VNKEQEKIWQEACNHEEKAKGYVSAELLMLPIFIGLAEEGLIDVGVCDNLTIIGTKGSFDKKEEKTDIDA
jgi:hypothetical protein